MREREDTPTDLHLLECANRQFGLLRDEDLLAAGLSRSGVGRRVDAGRLTRKHAGVFTFGHSVLRDEGIWLAARWACGPGAVLSHLTAAQFHGWPVPEPPTAVHITTTASRKSRPGIVIHRTRRLESVDVFRPGLLVVTAIPRTFVDLADVLSWPEYRALADAQRSLRPDAIRAAQERTPGRRGAPLVTRLVEADDAHTKSEFERRFLRFLRAHGLPRPDGVNVQVAGHEADCVYRDARLVVELDGRAFHRRRSQMRADRRRDTDYQLAGHRIMRLVWDDLHADVAHDTAARLRRMLDAGAR
jgi:very-short-patch-repair endonuclease